MHEVVSNSWGVGEDKNSGRYSTYIITLLIKYKSDNREVKLPNALIESRDRSLPRECNVASSSIIVTCSYEYVSILEPLQYVYCACYIYFG